MNCSKTVFYFAVALLTMACQPRKTKVPTVEKPKYSLGQWTYQEALFTGDMTTFDFIDKAKELNFQGVEFVNQFFKDRATDSSFLDSLASKLEATEISPIMIMVDGEGNLGDLDSTKRKLAVVQHKKWIEAASHIKAPYLRVNAHGTGAADEVLSACVRSLTELALYAKEHQVTILVENHGGYSSDGDWLVSLFAKLQPVSVAALADFDNWCMKRENGQLWGAPCTDRYDALKGMQQLLPYAKGLSVKAFDFDSNGEEITINYKELVQAVKDSGYRGYYGIEYEGKNHKTAEGIKLTQALVEKYY